MTNNYFKPELKLDKLSFNHSQYLPKNTFQLLIIGPSGTGKSFLLQKMILTPGFIDFNFHHLCTPSISP